MIKIAHIWYKYTPGFWEDLHRELLTRKDISSVLIAERLLEKKGVKPYENVYYFSKFRPTVLNERLNRFFTERLFRYPYEMSFKRFTEKILKEQNTSLIHAHFGMSGYKIVRLKRKLKIPLLVTFYGVDISYCLNNSWWIKLFKPMLKEADRFIVLCDEAKQRLEKLGCSSEKIKIWNCMADLDAYHYKERKPIRGVRFLIAARFVEKKSYPLLLQAFSLLAKKRKDVSLTILGHGLLKTKILNIIAELELSNIVKLIDTTGINIFSSFYNNQLDSHDVFVLPSGVAKEGDDEGGPAMTLVAAQAAGLPVICTPFPGSERSVIDGQTGILCRPNSVESLLEKMNFIADNKEIWNRLGKTASEYVNKNFTIESQTDKMIEIYKELLQER